ncbi:CRISPR system Cmr subunit Cmr5 [bacterium BMS3Abin13]|nr:CRISPR system Cmr subunit Cmr5 [bacterium BMS3Abin13]
MKTTLGQQRAKFCLEQLEKLDDKIRPDFKPLSAGLPAMILQNGFGQSLAFLLAKGREKHLAAFRIITAWLIERKIIAADRQSEILKQISNMPQEKYLQAQKETLAMLEWLKRYANAALFEGKS